LDNDRRSGGWAQRRLVDRCLNPIDLVEAEEAPVVGRRGLARRRRFPSALARRSGLGLPGEGACLLEGPIELIGGRRDRSFRVAGQERNVLGLRGDRRWLVD